MSQHSIPPRPADLAVRIVGVLAIVAIAAIVGWLASIAILDPAVATGVLTGALSAIVTMLRGVDSRTLVGASLPLVAGGGGALASALLAAALVILAGCSSAPPPAVRNAADVTCDVAARVCHVAQQGCALVRALPRESEK